MSTALSTPVITSQEAATRVAKLGMESELARMLEHVRHEVPGLQSIKVTLEYDPEGEDEPRVVIWCPISHRGLNYDPIEDELGVWKVSNFPSQVCQHFVMLVPICHDER